MSFGKDHDHFNSYCTAAIAGYGIATGNKLLLCVAGGFAIGTIWLSPDLDLKKSNPSNRLGVFSFLFSPYRALCGHHRSIFSHSPILSTALRVLYCLSPLIIYLGWQGQLNKLEWLLDVRVLSGYIGLELSAIVHLALDLQYSYRKKLKKLHL